jgi:hypothetical protein
MRRASFCRCGPQGNRGKQSFAIATSGFQQVAEIPQLSKADVDVVLKALWLCVKLDGRRIAATNTPAHIFPNDMRY